MLMGLLFTDFNVFGFQFAEFLVNKGISAEQSADLRTRVVRSADRSQFPYLNACILVWLSLCIYLTRKWVHIFAFKETLRIANLFPSQSPRITVDEVQIAGCLLPKGTAVRPLLSTANMDPTVCASKFRDLPIQPTKRQPN